MNKRSLAVMTSFVISILIISACSGISTIGAQATQPQSARDNPVQNQSQAVASTTLVSTQVMTTTLTQPQGNLLAAYESTLENIYAQVSPSVVNINVISQQSASNQQNPSLGLPGTQNNNSYSAALGSGFVWDTDGHIITNNHVIDGADNIQITFSDGETVPGKVIGADPQSDLAVVQVDVPAAKLQPVQIADSNTLKVGQLAIAIGNPFGLEGSMTVGIVSALGRSIPADMNSQSGSYTIPDIIQTDAPINPGNSGGVLTNDQGQVIGITSAIESPVSASAGIGFAIPSAILQTEVPVLISSGHFDHSYIGISGLSLTPDLSTAMSLQSDQQGALIEEVAPGGPADIAGLMGSQKQVTIFGQTATVGGDVIIGVDGQTIKSMDELIAYLYDHTTVGQKISLTILRNGQQQTVDVTLAARPADTTQASSSGLSNGTAWVGITGVSLDSDINQAMNLDQSQQGILIEQVENGSPADQAGLLGSIKPITINGQQIFVGGDIIVAIDGQIVSQLSDLRSFLSVSQPGDEAVFTIIRDGSLMDASIILGTNPAQSPG